MRSAYRQHDAGPIVNHARHPRGTGFLNTGQFPKFHNDRWGADGTYSLYTGLSGHPEGITTGVRFVVTTNVRAGHGFHIAGNPEQNPPIGLSQMMPAKPGERITASVWLRYTGTKVQAYGWRFRPGLADGSGWVDGGFTFSPITLPSGAWVRVSATYTVPAGTGSVAMMISASGGGQTDAIGDQIDATGLMVTRTPAPRANLAGDPYATTPTIPNNRFGWSPQWFGGGTGAGTTTPIVGVTDGPEGIPTYLRKTWTATNTGYADVAFTHVNANRARATEGETYTISSYFRSSKSWTVTTNCRLAIGWHDGSGVQIGGIVIGPNLPAVVAGAWHKLALTATAPVGAVTFRPFQLVYIENPGAWAVGDTIDGTGLMVTKEPPSWRFADGDSPGWRWLGAANTSESAGYALPA